MPNTLNTLYPPMIETFMPAFVYNQAPNIIFSYSPYNSPSEINRVHVSVVNQKTNKSVLKTTYNVVDEDSNLGGIVLDHIWIFNRPKNNSFTSFTIPSALLKEEAFEPDTFYKIQLRFDKETQDKPTDTSYLIRKRANFSEWSSVCLIKAIENICIKIQGMQDLTGDSYIKTVQPGIVPIAAYLDLVSSRTETALKERLQKYQILISPENQEENIIASSGWKYTGGNQDDNSMYWLADLTNTQADSIYDVRINAVTKNQYKLSLSNYQLKIANYDPVEFTPKWTYKSIVLNSFGNYQTQEEENNNQDKYIITEEDGQISFTITSEEDLPSGFLYVKRATSADNFKKWELIACIKNVGVLSETITDSTVGSLMKYRYSCQYRLMQKDLFTTTKYSPEFVYPNFYDILLYRQGRQIAIRLNGQINSFSAVVNRQVINTLGGKYPKFAENANMNYKKFSITGLLTVESDFNRKFINDRDYDKEMNDYNKYMDGKYEVRNDTIPDGDSTYKNISEVDYPETFDATHTNWDGNIKRKGQYLPATLHDLFPKDNWWLEREFREQALTWLNDGEPKLFRSMTEGNMCVMLTDISLTPNTQLGRRIYNISMTAYEIEDGYSLEVLDSLGIITIRNDYDEYINSANKEEQDAELMTTIEVVGQSYSKQRSIDKQNSNSRKFGVIADANNFLNKNYPNTYSLIDLYNAFYSGALKTYEVSEDSFELQDLRVQFESKPQWYIENRLATDEDILAYETDEDLPELMLGYKLGLKTKADESSDPEHEIFVNERGYYQVPSNIIVKQVILYDGAQATLDYKLSYKRTFNDTLLPSEIEVAEKIVGQISGKYSAGETISSTIKDKYEYYSLGNERDSEWVREHHYLDSITAIGFDGTPYTMLDIQFSGDKINTSILVGQTGVYNLMTDYPIEELTFKGRQMFKQDLSSKEGYHLKDWEFILDESAEVYDPTQIQLKKYWYAKYHTLTDYEVDILTPTQNGTIEFDPSEYLLRYGEDLYVPQIEGYKTTKEISNLTFNTVYGFKTNNSENKQLKIYYIDGKWYDVEFISNTNNTLILAKVPVYGMINYRGDLIKVKYE